MEYLKAFLNAIGALFGWLNKRSDLANSPEMKKRREAQDEQTQKDAGAVEISGAAKDDPESLRKLRNDLSE